MHDTRDTLALLHDLEAERCRAISERDRSQLETLLAADMQQIHASGVIEERSAYIETLLRRPRRCERTGEASVRIYGDAAIVTGPQRNTYADGSVGEMMTTLVWIRRQGRWQLAASQSTHVVRR